MAELDFSHRVGEIPKAASLPEPLERKEKIQTHGVPDFQSAISNYADATNWMSFIGSAVASKTSTALAQKLGQELGKNPQGDIGIPLTNFDKTMQESYRTQAQATLGLQANKLISDSNLEIAKADRITPDLIQKANRSVTIGLQNIFKNAPAEILPQMELHYGSLQLNQTADLTRRMLREQKEDRVQNTALAAQTNAENAYSFGLSGNEKAGLSAIKTTERLSQADVDSRLLSPAQAKANVDSARKAYLNGKLIHDYEAARANGKGEEYLRSVADKKPAGISDADYMSVTNNLISYVGHQQSLRNQDQQLRLAQFSNSIAMNPLAPDMPQQLQQLKENLEPIAYERAQLAYINAVKKFQTDTNEVNASLASWNDPAAFARIPDKAINQSFDQMKAQYIQQRNEQKNPISEEDAEVQIAAAAGGIVPVFRDTLQNRLNSGNPQLMDIAARQMDALYSRNASHALSGLTDKDKSIFTQYKALRDGLPPEEAAKIAIQNANQDPDTQQMNKQKWASFVKKNTGGGFTGAGAVSPPLWALRQAGLNKDQFLNIGIANEYGNMILNKYAALYQNMNGDNVNALKLVKEEVNQNFGDTGVNGGRTKTLHPIEKVLGYPENSDVVPFIQKDIINTLEKSFIPLKEQYDKGNTNSYWETTLQDTKNHALLYGSNYAPIKIKRYTQTPKGVQTDTYNVVIIGNSFNWDIALETESGLRPLNQIAPYLGIQTYTPNKAEIDAAYMNSRKR